MDLEKRERKPSQTGLKITIDGPAGTGKSTAAEAIAEKLELFYINSGAIFRTLTASLLHQDICLDIEDQIIHYLTGLRLELGEEGSGIKVFNYRTEITSTIPDIRSQEVEENVAIAAEWKSVQDYVKSMERELMFLSVSEGGKGAVIEGRDKGVEVAPEADLKVVLMADINERTDRKLKQLSGDQQKQPGIREQIKESLERRDKKDAEHLKPPEKALFIDTTHLSQEEVVFLIYASAKQLREKRWSVNKNHHWGMGGYLRGMSRTDMFYITHAITTFPYDSILGLREVIRDQYYSAALKMGLPIRLIVLPSEPEEGSDKKKILVGIDFPHQEDDRQMYENPIAEKLFKEAVKR